MVYQSGEDAQLAIERTRTRDPNRTFRDAMHTIVWVYLQAEAGTPFFEEGGEREVGTSSQYHSTADPQNQPPQNTPSRENPTAPVTRPRGSQASITGGIPP